MCLDKWIIYEIIIGMRIKGKKEGRNIQENEKNNCINLREVHAKGKFMNCDEVMVKKEQGRETQALEQCHMDLGSQF